MPEQPHKAAMREKEAADRMFGQKQLEVIGLLILL